jgi:hypothetical protein
MPETRLRLLQSMVENIRTRSLADIVFVSPFSIASKLFCESNMTTNDEVIMSNLKNISGNYQGKI